MLGVFDPSPGGARAFAAPAAESGSAEPVSLTLDPATGMRLAMAEDGASQEADTEKPKPMDEPKITVTKVTGDGSEAAAKKKSGPKKDSFAFVKDWPFWVIVGGVVVAGVAVFMIYRNANQPEPCGSRFTSGCFGEQ
jgi:hypothetical protein